MHGLLVMLHDPYQAPAVAKELAQALGPDYRHQDLDAGELRIS